LSSYNKLFQFVPGLAALHRMPISLRYKGTAEQKRYMAEGGPMNLFSLYQGKNIGKLAEVNTLGKGPLKQRIDVVGLELENGEKAVGLKVVAKSLLSYQAVPVSLSADQARELAHWLLQALGEE
jgi:hypothetical protein